MNASTSLPKLLQRLVLASALWLASGAQAQTAIERQAAPEDARAYIISPQDGERVSSPVLVQFGLSGMGVAPAGVMQTGSGHHHLLVDAELPALDQPIPSDAKHRHFGKGQTETSLELSAGPHSLQLLLGDQIHVPHDPPVLSPRIRIEVK